MSSQRISRGFHRLAILLAALSRGDFQRRYRLAQCAHDWNLAQERNHVLEEQNPNLPKDLVTPIEEVGCLYSDWGAMQAVSAAEAGNPLLAEVIRPYPNRCVHCSLSRSPSTGLVRAIGWVIGGFAASKEKRLCAAS